jgi:hypothetical protein
VIAAEVLPRERNSQYVGTGVPPQIATHSVRARMGDPLSDLGTAVAGRYGVVAGCPVRQKEQMPFTFNLAR